MLQPQLSHSVSSSTGFLPPIPGGPNHSTRDPMALVNHLYELDPFERSYRVGPVLGKGGFGTVYQGRRLRDGARVALKQIAKSKVTEWGQVRVLSKNFLFVLLNVSGHN